MHAFQSNRGLHLVFGNFPVMTMIIVSVVATTASGVLVSASLAVLTLLWMLYATYSATTVLTDMLTQRRRSALSSASPRLVSEQPAAAQLPHQKVMQIRVHGVLTACCDRPMTFSLRVQVCRCLNKLGTDVAVSARRAKLTHHASKDRRPVRVHATKRTAGRLKQSSGPTGKPFQVIKQ